MSDDFNQWQQDRELIHYEREEQDRFRRPGNFRMLWWVLFLVIVLPIAINSCSQM